MIPYSSSTPYIADFAPDDVICLSEYFFLKRWKAALLFFNVDSTFAAGFTPSSLRAGAATGLFLRGVPLPNISWLLRHARLDKLES